jgi:hypothetical protein
MTMVTSPSDVRIVPMTQSTAEVRLQVGARHLSIGRVAATAGRWYWQHRDGEQSSPVAASRTEAAALLANYHRAFKPQPAVATPTAAPTRRLLFG